MGSKDFFHILTSEYERPCPKDMPGTPNSIFTKTNRVAVWASPHAAPNFLKATNQKVAQAILKC